jgi:hypothetical protein
MMIIGHIRFYMFSAPKNTLAKTICGADPTVLDLTRTEALRLLNSAAAGCPDERIIVCARCAAIAKAGG